MPPRLSGKTIDKVISLNLNDFENIKYGDFSLDSFLNRYLAGSRSLKESRSVSRRRLALVTSNIGYIDPLAIDLASQVGRYNKAKQFLSSTTNMTLNNILEVNRLVEPENLKGGIIRTTQSWIGDETIFFAKFIFPPPEYVNELMKDWLDFVNSSSLPNEIIAILGHNQLIGIHPFADGNGRTGRIFLQVMFEKKYKEVIHPCLYRLNLKKDSYIQASDSTLDAKNLSKPLHSFWKDSLSWGTKTQKKMYLILAEGQSQLNNKLALVYLSENSRKLLHFLWMQPIVCESGLLQRFGWDFFTSQIAIQELINASILEARRLKQPEGAIIYDCPIMFTIWQKLDDLIFES